MLPAQLTAESFAQYPQQARAFAVENLALIRQLPLTLAALLLREVAGFDWRFPAERRTLEDQAAYLTALPAGDREHMLAGFAAVVLPEPVRAIDWVKDPQAFVDALTSTLWSTHQIGPFREAAAKYAEAWRAARPEPQPPIPRLTIVVLGKGLRSEDAYPLFRKLRPHGVFAPQVDLAEAWGSILNCVTARVTSHQIEYGHWYIDGASPDRGASGRLTTISYAGVQPVREAILKRMEKTIGSGYSGPEELRTMLAQTTPRDLGLGTMTANDEAMSRFAVSVLTEGSGTQIFSTTFVQWTAREALRRAQPCTLLLRYAARRRQLPMNEMLHGNAVGAEPDAKGSLVDADMGAYYTWINQQRLTGADQAAFVAWSEEHGQAVLIGPAMPRGTTAGGTMTMRQILTGLA